MQRANDSACLSDKFPKLRSLTVELTYFEADGLAKKGGLKYKVNVQHARSLFLIVCPNCDCVGGGFDLSTAVSDAVGARRKVAGGEIQCLGSARISKQGDTVPCRYLLRFKLSLGYV